jgi:hypothetical protein
MSRKESKAQTFIERYLGGEAGFEEIDDYVDAWHRTPQGVELHEFLGMSKEEYALWLRNPDALSEIARARKERERRVAHDGQRSTTQTGAPSKNLPKPRA